MIIKIDDSLISKIIPEKVCVSEGYPDSSKKSYYCPNCQSYEGYLRVVSGGKELRFNYCGKCGQKLDWNE